MTSDTDAEDTAARALLSVLPLQRQIARAIMLRVQGNEFGHWSEEHNPTGSARERVFHTTAAEIDLLEQACSDAAADVIALLATISDVAPQGLPPASPDA